VIVFCWLLPDVADSEFALDFWNHVVGSWGQKSGIMNATWPTCWSSWSLSSFAAILYVHKGVWPRSQLQSRAGKRGCEGWEYPLPLYMLSFIVKNVHVGAVAACKVERGVTRCGEM
jgi:hypothetical protein